MPDPEGADISHAEARFGNSVRPASLVFSLQISNRDVARHGIAEKTLRPRPGNFAGVRGVSQLEDVAAHERE
jgi:hypothetical protein